MEPRERVVQVLSRAATTLRAALIFTSVVAITALGACVWLSYQLHLLGREHVAMESGAAKVSTRIHVKDGKIEVYEKIFFARDSNEIKPDSYALFGEIATFLKQSPSIELVSVEVHSDDVGEPDHSLYLTRQRADSVVKFLEACGVEGGRLESRGFGTTRPIVLADTDEARSQNRRIEFVIVRQKE